MICTFSDVSLLTAISHDVSETFLLLQCRCSSIREIVNSQVSLSLSLSLSLLSVRPSGSLINGHDERDFEDKKVSHMKQKRRIIAANDNVQKETEGSLSVRWREEKEEELKLSQENWKDRKREREADGLRTVANFGNYCDAEQFSVIYTNDKLLPSCWLTEITWYKSILSVSWQICHEKSCILSQFLLSSPS